MRHSARAPQPTYQELCARYGFPVPPAYHRLIQLAFRISPEDPWDAFELIGLIQFDATRANPEFKDEGHDYVDTPVEAFIFGWLGTDGVHYAFLVDDWSTVAGELPIIEVAPSEGCRLLAASVGEFVEFKILETMACRLEDDDPLDDEKQEIITALAEEFNLSIPESLEEGLDDEGERQPKRLIEIVRTAQIDRKRKGAYPTVDELGILLPNKTVDKDILSFSGDTILDEAERRLAASEPGTALILARNYRTLHWYDDWKTSKNKISRTADIMERAYRALGRDYCARRIRTSTEWAIKNVI